MLSENIFSQNVCPPIFVTQIFAPPIFMTSLRRCLLWVSSLEAAKWDEILKYIWPDGILISDYLVKSLMH